jgi:hypothetical protein
MREAICSRYWLVPTRHWAPQIAIGSEVHRRSQACDVLDITNEAGPRRTCMLQRELECPLVPCDHCIKCSQETLR